MQSEIQENPFPEQIFKKIKYEFLELYAFWLLYKQIYDGNEDQIAFLNKTASNYFSIIRKVLLNEIMITLIKLTDTANGNNKNLSLEQLINHIEDQKYSVFKYDLCQKLIKIKEDCRDIRQIRNKKLVHLDFKVSMELKPLPHIHFDTIEKVILDIAEFMNLIELKWQNTQTGYAHMVLSGGGKTLLYHLKNGIEYEKIKENEAISPLDF